MIKNSKLSRYKLLKVVDCFCIDVDATKSSQLLQLNRNTTNRYFNVFRELIAAHQRAEKEQFVGVVEVDESFFGSARLVSVVALVRESEDEELTSNLCSVFMNVMAVFIPNS